MQVFDEIARADQTLL